MGLLYFVASAFSFKFAVGDQRSWVAMDFQDDNDLLDCLKSSDDESESGSMVLDGVSNSEFFSDGSGDGIKSEAPETPAKPKPKTGLRMCYVILV